MPTVVMNIFELSDAMGLWICAELEPLCITPLPLLCVPSSLNHCEDIVFAVSEFWTVTFPLGSMVTFPARISMPPSPKDCNFKSPESVYISDPHSLLSSQTCFG